ncbi:hypothetical protein DFH09DRAFT_1073276 [Mycena vulgaris]|nr:hypothetical protein DFH09DRAFT_1073276 [Mycena vulgaris]
MILSPVVPATRRAHVPLAISRWTGTLASSRIGHFGYLAHIGTGQFLGESVLISPHNWAAFSVKGNGEVAQKPHAAFGRATSFDAAFWPSAQVVWDALISHPGHEQERRVRRGGGAIYCAQVEAAEETLRVRERHGEGVDLGCMCGSVEAV